MAVPSIFGAKSLAICHTQKLFFPYYSWEGNRNLVSTHTALK
jgi:hypothetical protein